MPEVVEGYRLSPQQERVWGLSGGVPGAAFCAGCVVLVEGATDAGALSRSLSSVVARHEILRTKFESVAGLTLPLQVVGDAHEVAVEEYDLTGRAADEREAEVDLLFREMRQSGA